MKKRVFSIFLILAFLLTALAGCSPGSEGPSRSSGGDDPEEQLLASGYYEVYDEDDELVGYLRVTSSKIIVYDKKGNEKDTLRYDYNEKKALYTLDGGKLFGCEEFTVEKNRKVLKLITEDDDEYTLEAISKSDLPSGGGKESSGPKPAETPSGPSGAGADEPDPGYIELPIGCYAVYNDSDLQFYLKVTKSTMISYYTDGDIEGEFSYSYNRDGLCVIEADDGPSTAQITYERGSYYMRSSESYSYAYRLEPVSESEIPVYGRGDSYADSYYIGGNGSIYLYAWMPDALYHNMDYNYDDGIFMAQSQSYDSGSGASFGFLTLLASGDTLQMAIEEAREHYHDAYTSPADLMFRSLQDEMLSALDEGYVLDRYVGYMDYDLYEGYETINGRSWRYCEAYAEDAYAGLTILLWMEGDNMAAVVMGGIAENSRGLDDLGSTLTSIIYSLEIY